MEKNNIRLLNKTNKRGKDSLSLIVKSYLSEKTIVKDIKVIADTLKELKIPYEIILVADGNVEKTKSIFAKKRINHLKIVGYKTKHGIGYAVRFGMAHAKGNIIAFLDAGMNIDPMGIFSFLQIMKTHNADIVIGSKTHTLSQVPYPWMRKFLALGYQSFTKLFLGLSVKDTQVGFKVFHRKVLEDVLPRLLVKQYAFDVEMLAVAHRLGYTKIYEAPITLTFRNWLPLTSKTFIETTVRTLWDTLAIFYRLKVLGYYDNSSRRKWKYDPELNFRINIP